MSDYESHSGKLRLVKPLENETFEEQCKRLWVENGKEGEYFNVGEFFDELYEKYLNVNDKLWEIIEHKEYGDEDDMFCRLYDNKDGTFSFHTRFYNGGTYLTEMVTEALERLEKKK